MRAVEKGTGVDSGGSPRHVVNKECNGHKQYKGSAGGTESNNMCGRVLQFA